MADNIAVPGGSYIIVQDDCPVKGGMVCAEQYGGIGIAAAAGSPKDAEAKPGERHVYIRDKVGSVKSELCFKDKGGSGTKNRGQRDKDKRPGGKHQQRGFGGTTVMGKFVCTENAALQGAGGTPAAPVSLAGKGGAKLKAGGKPVLLHGLHITVPTFQPAPGATGPGSPAGPFVFSSAAHKVKSGGKLVLLEGDKSAHVIVTWPSNGGPISSPVSAIPQSAGQRKVKAL